MLYTRTVAPGTLSLFKALTALPALATFALVGGTNLSLRYGHRISVDLDLFTNTPFEPDEVFSAIVKARPQTVKIDQRKQSIFLTVDGIKIDLILHEYPYLRGIETVEGLRLLSVEDIIPMKLEAMATRGVKKDFWDVAELLDHYSLRQMLDFHQKKYKNSDLGHILLSATYFADAERERIDPLSLNGVTWPQVKAKMQRAVKAFVKGAV